MFRNRRYFFLQSVQFLAALRMLVPTFIGILTQGASTLLPWMASKTTAAHPVRAASIHLQCSFLKATIQRIGICLATIAALGINVPVAVADHYTGDLYEGPLFETHAHIVHYRSESVSEVEYKVDAREEADPDLTVQTYLDNRDSNDITCTIAFHGISLDDTEEELLEHADTLLRDYPGQFILFAEIFRDNPLEWFDASLLEDTLDSGLFSGFGEIQLSNIPFSNANSGTRTIEYYPNWGRLLEIYTALGDRGLFVMAHPYNLDYLSEAIAHDLRVTWILHGPGVHERWTNMDALADLLDNHDNLYYTLDFAESLAAFLDITKGRGHPGWTDEELHTYFLDQMSDPDFFDERLTEMEAYWKDIIETYPDRFMWGTDMAAQAWTWEDPDVIDLMVEFSRAFIALLDSSTAEKFAYQNAESLFGACDEQGGEIEFGLATSNVDEGVGTAVMQVQRSGNTTLRVNVDYVVSDGTATSGLDYSASSGTLMFGPGETSAEISIPIIDDAAPEDMETIHLSLHNPTHGARLGSQQTATLAISNNDVRFRFTSASFDAVEGDGIAEITVERLGGTPTPVSVTYETSDGTAFAGSDYIGATGTLTFDPGDPPFQTFNVTIYDDIYPEPHRTFNVRLTSPFNVSGAAGLATPDTAQVRILNDDVAFRFSNTSYSVGENDGQATIRVRRMGALPPGITTSVEYATIIAGSTAVAGTDYDLTSGTLEFGPGETAKEFQVTILDNSDPEDDRTVNLKLGNPYNPVGHARLVTPDTARLTIHDDDVAFAFSRGAYTARETDGVVEITVERSGASSQAASVDYQTDRSISRRSGATALLDYIPVSGTLDFAAGDTTQTFEVTLIADSIRESSERVNLSLSNPTISDGTATLASPDTAKIIIQDR